MADLPDQQQFREWLIAAESAEAKGDWSMASSLLFQALRIERSANLASRYVIALWKAERFEICERDTAILAAEYPHDSELAEHVVRVSDFMKYHHVARCVEAFENQSFTEALRHGIRASKLWPDHPWVANYIEMSQLRAPGFGNRLTQDKRRIFIAGCGRSGTYLLSAMMQCFEDTYVHPGEAPAEAFALLEDAASTHVIKRVSDSYKTLHLVPEDIGLIHIVRHPFDVLTSEHMGTFRYIKPNDWNAEIDSMRHLKRANHLVIRYEDLVRGPDSLQSIIQAKYGLNPARKFSEFHLVAQVPGEISESMHGLRAPSESSVQKWRRDIHEQGYLRSIWPDIETNFNWLCSEFGYEPIGAEFKP
ncbi:MAG: hypothetical protein IPK75_00180 [Acidobacteria bacterium]|nr:hypothetical protein [Acidobacteriota bacterium]